MFCPFSQPKCDTRFFYIPLVIGWIIAIVIIGLLITPTTQSRMRTTLALNLQQIKSPQWQRYCNATMKNFDLRNTTNRHNGEFYRLTSITTPNRYKLRLRIDTERKKLYGHLLVNIRIHNKTNVIEMNGIKLKIMTAIFRTGFIRVDANMVYYCPNRETFVLHFPKYLHRGEANITLNFVANLSDLYNHGLLRIFYENRQRLIITDFGPIDARHLFPCYDEPRYKATFDLYVIVPKNNMVFSNRDIVRQRSYSQDLDEIKFVTTPPISTYQLATVIAPKLEVIISKNNRTDVKLRIITTDPSNQDQWSFALETGEFLLNYFQYYLGIKYPIEKLDLLVLKHYEQTSIEKLGLIYFTHKQLSVLNRTLATEKDLQLVASSLAHSISHQWLGNSVTFNDWSEFWLFESLSQFLEKQAMDDLFPQWRSWQQYVANEMTLALRFDASIYAEPVLTSIRHPANVSKMYPHGINVFRKTTSLLRMLQSNLGEEIFQNAIQLFVKRHWNKIASSNDLWRSFLSAINHIQRDHFKEFSHFQKQIVRVISNWTRLAGFPVLHVQEEQQGTTRILKLRQERFVELLRDEIRDLNQENIWPIPVSIINAFSPFTTSNQVIITEKQVELRIPDIWNGEWIKLNPYYHNFYRVHYSEEMLARFSISIEEKLLTPLDRLNLIDDTFAMIRAGYSTTISGLKLLLSFKNEDNPNIWSVIISSLTDIHLLISNIDSDQERKVMKENFNYYGQQILKRIYHKLGWYPNVNLSPVGYKMKIFQFAQSELREKILCAMGQFEHRNFIQESKQKYLDYLNGKSDLPLSILECVFRAYKAFGELKINTTVKENKENFNFQQLFEYYTDYNVPEARHLFSIAIGATDRPEEIKQVIQFALKSMVHPEDTRRMLLELARYSRLGRFQILDAFQQRFFEFLEKFSMFNELYDFVRDFIETFAKREELKPLNQLLSKYSTTLGPLSQALRFSFEKIQVMEQWFERDRFQIQSYLRSVYQMDNANGSESILCCGNVTDYGDEDLDENHVAAKELLETDDNIAAGSDYYEEIFPEISDNFFSIENNFDNFDDGRRRR